MFRLTSKQTFKLKPMSLRRCQPRRVISTVLRRNTDGCSHHDDGYHHDNSHHHGSNSGDGGSKSASFVTWREFSNLDKEVSLVKLKLDHLASGQKDLGNRVDRGFEKMDRGFERADRKTEKTDTKIDRVLYSIITAMAGFLLKGGFDYYYLPAS